MSTKTVTSEVPKIVIKPSRGWRVFNLRELWSFRELIYFLTWRDIKVRYKQTAIGIAWAVLQPLAMMLVFTLIFGRLAKMPSEGVPYPLFAYAALLPWQLFARALTESSNSLVTDQRLITRVYFPRLIVPMSTVLAAIVDFLIASLLLIGLMLIYGVSPSLTIVWVPAFVLFLLITALGTGFWLSALNLEYRDVQYTVPFLTQLWFFLTPVVYPSTIVPAKWRVLYSLNPMSGVVEGFRWSLLGVGSRPGPVMLASVVVALALFVGGIVFFRRRERTFVDAVGSGGL